MSVFTEIIHNGGIVEWRTATGSLTFPESLKASLTKQFGEPGALEELETMAAAATPPVSVTKSTLINIGRRPAIGPLR